MSIEQTKTISTPKVYINGSVWPIEPNSFKYTLPGEVKVRSMSSGGGNVQIVAGVDASKLLGKVKFAVAATKQMIDRVKAVKALSNAGVGATCRAGDPPWAESWSNMFLANETEVMLEAEGKIELEFDGEYTSVM